MHAHYLIVLIKLAVAIPSRYYSLDAEPLNPPWAGIGGLMGDRLHRLDGAVPSPQAGTAAVSATASESASP